MCNCPNCSWRSHYEVYYTKFLKDYPTEENKAWIAQQRAIDLRTLPCQVVYQGANQ